MSLFEPAFDYMIRNEDRDLTGDITNEPNGGKARFGINSLFHLKAVADGFYELPRYPAYEYAKDFYLKTFWNSKGFDTIPDQTLATKLFDTAVNLGYGGLLTVLQKALGVTVTHKLDQATQDALNKVDSSFINAFVNTLKERYKAIYNANPIKYAKIIDGWLARASKIPS